MIVIGMRDENIVEVRHAAQFEVRRQLVIGVFGGKFRSRVHYHGLSVGKLQENAIALTDVDDGHLQGPFEGRLNGGRIFGTLDESQDEVFIVVELVGSDGVKHAERDGDDEKYRHHRDRYLYCRMLFNAPSPRHYSSSPKYSMTFFFLSGRLSPCLVKNMVTKATAMQQIP